MGYDIVALNVGVYVWLFLADVAGLHMLDMKEVKCFFFFSFLFQKTLIMLAGFNISDIPIYLLLVGVFTGKRSVPCGTGVG